jgi:hypothetical protein
MTHLLAQSRNDSEHEGTPQTDSLRDSSVNHARYKLMKFKQEKRNDTAR